MLPQIKLWTDSADGPPVAEVAHVLATLIEAQEGTQVYRLEELTAAAVLTYLGHHDNQGMTNAFAALQDWAESSRHQETGPRRQVCLGLAESGAMDRFEIKLQLPVG